MGTPCSTCRYFRPYRPLSQRLGIELGLQFTEVISELVRMAQDERQRRDEEAGLKVKLLGDRVDRWPHPPQMSSYCALLEESGVYFLIELKNRGGRCPDHAPGRDEPRSCDTCTQRCPAPGPARDEARLAELAKLTTDYIASGIGQPAHGLPEEMRLIGAMMSLEATQAYYLGKMAPRPPDYLAVCRKLSTDTDFLPCVVMNPHDACRLHEAVPTFQGAQPPVASEPGPAATAPGGGPSVSIPMPTWR